MRALLLQGIQLTSVRRDRILRARLCCWIVDPVALSGMKLLRASGALALQVAVSEPLFRGFLLAGQTVVDFVSGGLNGWAFRPFFIFRRV